MDNSGEPGIFLTLNDCAVVFPRLKKNETFLSIEERMLMLRIEKILYENLSIQEMEELLDKGTYSSNSRRRL